MNEMTRNEAAEAIVRTAHDLYQLLGAWSQCQENGSEAHRIMKLAQSSTAGVIQDAQWLARQKDVNGVSSVKNATSEAVAE